MVAHYFPGKDIDNMEVDEFAMWSCNAEWLHNTIMEHQKKYMFAHAIATAFGGGEQKS